MGLQFDKYQARAQCVLGFLAAVAIFERSVIKELGLSADPTLDFDRFLGWAHEKSTNIRAKAGERRRRLMDEYFLPPGHLRHAEFSGKNKQDVTPLVAEFMAGLLSDHYFREGSPLVTIRNQRPVDESYGRLARQIEDFKDKDYFQKVLDDSKPETAPQESLKRFLTKAFGEVPVELRHPNFPSLPIFDLRAVKAENHGVNIPDANAGLLAIVREPRGLAAQEESDVNLLVRDILWLSPIDARAKMSSARAKAPVYGFYASLMDPDAFVIDAVQKEQDTIIVLGKLEHRGKKTQRTRVVFSKFQQSHPLQTSYGVVAGTTGDDGDHFSAWKTLVIRPDWPDTAKLEALLYQCGPQEQATAYSILSDAGALCVLFSKDFRKEYPACQERRDTFRSLIASDPWLIAPRPDVLGDLLRAELTSTLASIFEEEPRRIGGGRAGPDLLYRVLDAIEKLITDRWHLIEPAQIIVFKEPHHTSTIEDLMSSIRQPLSLLLERNNIRTTRQASLREAAAPAVRRRDADRSGGARQVTPPPPSRPRRPRR